MPRGVFEKPAQEMISFK